VCHVQVLKLDHLAFCEPSPVAAFRDTLFPSGADPVAMGLRSDYPVEFDVTRDQPDNRIHDSSGNITYRMGSFQKDAQGRALVECYGDMKRHDMGPGLAEAIDETGVGASVFMTENLWGVGSTAPYLHDGRATTVTEAILEHGGEAAVSSAAFQALPTSMQQDVVAFLQNLVLFKLPED
jgi:cytochrome c peroxidase